MQNPTGPGIGTALKDARRRLGMDVKEAEERTKIRARYLRALEADDWEVLPAPAYVRGFLRTYGELLGLDGDALADEFRRRHEEPAAVANAASEPILKGARRAPGSRPPSRGPLIVAIGVGIVILLVILGSIGGSDDPAPAPADTERPRPAQGEKGGPAKNSNDPVPIALTVEPLDAMQVCLVGGSGEALIDGQMLAPGAAERFSDYKTYRLDLEGGSAMKLTAGGKAQRVASDAPTSYEADSNGIREIPYAGPECP
ncbi:MAG: helix-turn-helix domain-containing protein [Solirubrobacterales bacterium]|nr:helix-turn-helix domain-containing protein [Solirubrobacterales bacterium]